MACRKAADRALMAVASWREEQQENLEERRSEFLKTQYEEWIHPPAENSPRKPPPPAMSMGDFDDRYCIQWLADGPEVPHHDSLRGGCSGGCGKFHPRLVLDWNNEHSHGIVLLEQGAEALVPFQNYMQKLCQQDMATCIPNEPLQNSDIVPDSKHSCSSSTPSYRLTGFLLEHLTTLNQQAASQGDKANALRNHLYKVHNRGALEASKKAHEMWMEQQDFEQAQKRRKLAEDTDNHMHTELLTKVLSICYNTGALSRHLNVIDIAFMRCASTLFRGYARLLSEEKMKALLRPSFKVYEHITLYPCQEEEEKFPIVIDPLNPSRGFRSGISIFQLLDHQVRGQQQGGFPMQPRRVVDKEGTDESSTDGSIPRLSMTFIPQSDSEIPFMTGSNMSMLRRSIIENYRGHLYRIGFLQEGLGACPWLEVARFWLDSRDYTTAQEISVTAQYGIPLSAKFYLKPVEETRTNAEERGTENPEGQDEETERVENPENEQGDDESEGNDDDYDPWVKLTTQVELVDVSISFGDLLGVHVRRELPCAKAHLKEIQQQRPATRSEKDYVRALAKAAREAPGNGADTFRGMDGWD